MANSELEALVRAVKPAALLDVGCGCGHFTRKLVQPGCRVVAIDVVRGPGWQELGRASGVHFCRMNALALGFASNSFPLVIERAALHHFAHWADALTEMIRVCNHRVALQEPEDDLRSAAKQRTFEAQGLFLALQAEVGYPHYRHLSREEVLSAVTDRAVILEAHVERSDSPRSFDEFFRPFGEFVAQSVRQDYWWDKLGELRSRFDGAPLCEDDTLTVLAATGDVPR